MKYQIYTWAGHLGLPSFDPACLAIETFLQIVSLKSGKSLPYSIINARHFSLELPIMDIINDVDNRVEKTLRGLPDILAYFLSDSDQSYNLDEELSASQLNSRSFFTQMIQSVFYDAILIEWFGWDENRRDILTLFAKQLPLLSRTSFIYNNYLTERVMQRLDCRLDYSRLCATSSDHVLDSRSNESFEKIKRCLEALEVLVGEKQTCFGTEWPTSLDCILYSYLSIPLISSSLSSSQKHTPIKTLLLFEYPNLVRFVEVFRTRYFEDSAIRFCDSVWGHMTTELPAITSLRSTLLSITSLTSWIGSLFSTSQSVTNTASEQQKQKSQSAQQEQQLLELKQFKLKRNLSIVGSVVAVVFYAWMRGLLPQSISFQTVGNGDDQSED